MHFSDIFYLTGSIFHILAITILIVIGYLLYRTVLAIEHTKEMIEEKVEKISKAAARQPSELAKGIGSAAAGLLTVGIRRIFSRGK